MKKLFAILLAVIAIAAAPSTSDAQLADITLKDLSGKNVNVSQLDNDGKPIVISFFATWCKPCMRELKAIHEVYPDWQDETGMKMYIVSIDEAQNASKVKPLVDAQGWEYDVLLDPNKDFYRSLGIQNVPHTIILDGKGQIIFNHSGYTDGGESEIIKTIREKCGK